MTFSRTIVMFLAATFLVLACSHVQEPPATKTFDGMIAAGDYDYVDSYITEENFPVDSSRFTTDNTKVFHFGWEMTTAEVKVEIRKEGYEPAGLERLLAYVAENPEEQRKHPVIALGTFWVDPNGYPHVPYVPYLREDSGRRDLDLYWDVPGRRWDGVCRFLAVRKSGS